MNKTAHPPSWPPGDSEMARRIGSFDWSATPLGPSDRWSAELKLSVNLVVESAFPAALVWGSDLTTIHNDAFRPILGKKPDALGRSFADVWSEAWTHIKPFADRAYAGHSTFIENYPLVVERGGRPEQAYFTFSYSPVRSADGTVLGMMDTVVETTGAVTAEKALRDREEHQTLLLSELQHRVRNTLAIIRSIVRRSAETSETVEELAMHLDGRVAAFARVQAAVTRDPAAGLNLETLVADTLMVASARGSHEPTINGPRLDLTPKAAETIGLALHELTTNALKYGALSERKGKIAISWRITQDAADPVLELIWIERGVRIDPSQKRREGFGSELIMRTLVYEMEADVDRNFTEDGVRYLIRIPATSKIIKS